MLRQAFGVFMLVSVGALVAADTKDTKDKEKVEGKTAKVVKVDLDKKILTVMTDDKKKIELVIGDDVQFIGPRGGVSKEGLKDDRLAVGNEITLVYADKAGKKLKEVRLPVRDNDKDKAVKDKAVKDK